MSTAWNSTGLIVGAYGRSGGLISVGGGSTVREISAADYATRLADYAWNDGDLGMVTETGLVRIYDATAEDLVRECEYGLCTVRKRMSGAVEPDHVSEGWLISETVAGNVSSNGTHVTCTTDGQLAQIYYSHGLGTTTKHSLSFFAQVTAAATAANKNRAVYLETGAYRVHMALTDAASGGKLNFTDSNGSVIASFDAPGYPSSEALIELFVSDKHALIYYNHSVLPVLGLRTDAFGAAATTYISFGNYLGSSGVNTQKFRQVAHRTYT